MVAIPYTHASLALGPSQEGRRPELLEELPEACQLWVKGMGLEVLNQRAVGPILILMVQII